MQAREIRNEILPGIEAEERELEIFNDLIEHLDSRCCGQFDSLTRERSFPNDNESSVIARRVSVDDDAIVEHDFQATRCMIRRSESGPNGERRRNST